MKICMVTTFYPPYHFGGDATYVRALSEQLASLGHEVTVVHCEDAYRLGASGPVREEPRRSAVQVLRLRKRGGFLSPLITQQLGIPGLKSADFRRLFAEPFDVVNFHNVSLVGGPGVISMSGAPVNLYTLHEHWLICATHILWKNRSRACDSRECIRCSVRSGIPPQWWRYTPLLERSLARIDRFISPSRYTARRHEEQLSLAAPVEVLPLFSQIEPALHEPVTPNATEFLYVGRMTAAKGVRELVEAFAGWPQYRLTVIGEGELLASLRRGYAGRSNIQFLGAVPQSQLIDHYRRACALIMPSLAPETFGLTVVEAFACGTPAIVREAGGNREAVDDSGAGFVYEDDAQLRGALDTLAGDPALRDELGARARAAFESRYTPAVHIRRYLDLVETVRREKHDNNGVLTGQ